MAMRALPPLDAADQARPSTDRALGGYSILALERLLGDCEDQPLWRDTSDLCCAYHDGHQLSAEQIRMARQNGLDFKPVNLIQRVVHGVLGQEAKSRRDPALNPDDDAYADVADVLNVKLKEAQRETNADMSISNGYASQVKAGVGFVEVSRVSDPLDYPYRVQDVHRNELWWDWRAKKIDLSDARWLCRRQWKDLDEVVASFPEHREALEHSVNNWATWLFDDMMEERIPRNDLAFQSDRAFRVNRSEWIDGGRQRVRMYEVWYRVPAEVVVMRVGHRWVIADEKNPTHIAAIQRGLVPVRRAVTSMVRCALYAGPYRLLDKATTKRRFPYIPFFAFRADGDNTPYGLIHGMLAPQDEYNDRRMRIHWMLKAQQLIIESDALDPAYNNIADIAASMMRPDMVAVLNPNRKGARGMEFRNDLQLQKEQFDVMQDAKQLIQDVPGVYSAQLGNAPTGVTSGLAINSLVEQGLVAMGELNDNYAFSRRLVFEALVDLIAEDHLQRDMQVSVGTGQQRRVVVLNTRDERGMPMNVVKDAPVKVGLGEVPASPAYQMQMSQMMGDMIRALAGTPHAGILIPSWVEQTSAFGPGRKQLADDMRRSTGLPTGGDRQGAQAWQQQQQQAAAAQAALAQKQAATAIAEQEAKIDETQAKVAKTVTEAELNTARIAEIHARLSAPADPSADIADALAEADT